MIVMSEASILTMKSDFVSAVDITDRDSSSFSVLYDAATLPYGIYVHHEFD